MLNELLLYCISTSILDLTVPLMTVIKLCTNLVDYKKNMIMVSVAGFSYNDWLSERGLQPGSIDSTTAKELLDNAGVAAYMREDKCYRLLAPYGDGWTSGYR